MPIELLKNVCLKVEELCFGRPLERQLRIFFLLILIATLVLAVVSVRARGFAEGFQINSDEWRNLGLIGFGCLICFIAGYCQGQLRADKYTAELKVLVGAPLKEHRIRLFFLMFIFALIVGCAWIFTAYVDTPISSGGKPVHVRAVLFLFENPGGAFAIITGVVTVAGTYLTLISINNIKGTFASFNDFLIRATGLIDLAAKESDTVCVCSLSPVPGILQAEVRHVTSYHQALERLAASANSDGGSSGVKRVDLITLTAEDLSMWLARFEGRRKRGGNTVTTEDVTKAVASNEHFLAGSEMSDGASIRRLSTEQIPGSYYVCSSQRAVICVPLFIPLAAGAEAAERSLENMQMVGFETTDHIIIDFLRAFHAVYAVKVLEIKEIISTGEISKAIVDQIQKLLGNPAEVNGGSEIFRARFYAAIKSPATQK